MQRLLSVVKILPSLTTVSMKNLFMKNSFQQFPNTQLLLPSLPSVNPVCGLKVRGRLSRRCKSCYFVVRDERLYVMCPKAPRHKQMAMKAKPLNTYILTHASQSPKRPW